MKTFLFPLLVVILSITPITLFAQSIKVGTWTGTIAFPSGKTSDVKYDVKVIGDSLSITLITPEMGNPNLDDIQLDKSKLSFSWYSESQIDCALDLQNDGSYEGQCIYSNGGKGRITMIPPKSSK